MTSCWPHDRAYGGQLRALHIGRVLQDFGRPTLVVVGADEVDASAREKTAAEFDLGREIKICPSPVRGVAAASGRSILEPDFTNIHGFAAQPEDEQWLLQAQRQYDVVWFFKLRTANMLTNARWRRSVVDIDDLPSSMERTLWRSGTDARVRMKAWLRMLELRVHESRLKRRFDVFAVCSKADRTMLSKRSRVRVIPNGFAKSATVPVRNPSQPPRIGFMGLYSYLPNLEGIRWFMKCCWPQIKKEIPDVRLRLVGQDSDGPLKPIDPQVDGLGWVENPADEIATWSMMIVPIRIGAGTRVKIADAFSRKCPVVSTRFGALGYEVQNGKDLILADSPAEFASGCISLIRKPAFANQIADEAYRAFLEKWTWDAAAPQVWGAVEDCLRMNWVG